MRIMNRAGKGMDNLFDAQAPPREAIAEGAMLLRGFAAGVAPRLMDDLAKIVEAAPLRHMVTPGGFTMSVAMTNCGQAGWVSDLKGYRYDARDPVTGMAWPAMPASFRQLAPDAAREAGYEGFEPDACLINRYEPGARLTLHQDRNERDYTCADRVGVVGTAGGVSVRRRHAEGSSAPHAFGERRCRGVGWSHAPGLPRRRVAKGWRAPAHRPLPDQSDVSQGAVKPASHTMTVEALVDRRDFFSQLGLGTYSLIVLAGGGGCADPNAGAGGFRQDRAEGCGVRRRRNGTCAKSGWRPMSWWRAADWRASARRLRRRATGRAWSWCRIVRGWAAIPRAKSRCTWWAPTSTPRVRDGARAD